jgi:hypothetical protein
MYTLTSFSISRYSVASSKLAFTAKLFAWCKAPFRSVSQLQSLQWLLSGRQPSSVLLQPLLLQEEGMELFVSADSISPPVCSDRVDFWIQISNIKLFFQKFQLFLLILVYYSHFNPVIYFTYGMCHSDHLCSLVVRVPNYRSRGPGSIPGVTRFSEK